MNDKNDLTEVFYKMGKLPDRYYNQLNGKSAQENYAAFKSKRQEELNEDNEEEYTLIIKSEVK